MSTSPTKIKKKEPEKPSLDSLKVFIDREASRVRSYFTSFFLFRPFPLDIFDLNILLINKTINVIDNRFQF